MKLKSVAESLLDSSSSSSSTSSSASSSGLSERALSRLEDFKQGGSGTLNFDSCSLDDALADAGLKLVRRADLLESVSKLSLASNALTRLPADAAQLAYLIELNVSANALKKPDALRGVLEACRSLESLDVSNNQLDALPDDVGSLRLRRLDVSNNGHFRLKPGNADALAARLQQLLIASNNLGSLPGAVLQLHALRELDLHDNGLSDVPDRFSELPMLETLNLSANRLAQCPSTLTHLKKLQLLNVSRNQFTSLTAEFCAALSSTLTSLELAGNRLGECTAAAESPLARLTSVQLLDLSDNRIEKLSPSFGLMTKLRTLKLEQNCISQMPVQLILLQTNLRELDLSANPLRELPPEYGYFSVEYGGLIPRIKLVGVPLEPPASRMLAESDRALMRHLKEKARYHPPFAALRFNRTDSDADVDADADADAAAVASPRSAAARPMAHSQPERVAPALAKTAALQRPAAALPPASTGARAAVMLPAQVTEIRTTLDALLSAAAQLDDASQLEFDFTDAMRPHARKLGELTRDMLGMVRTATNNNETEDINARALAAAAVRLATAASAVAKATRERAAEASATEISDDLTAGQVAMQTTIKALVAEAETCKRAITAAQMAARVNASASAHVPAAKSMLSPRALATAGRTPSPAQSPAPSPAPSPSPVRAAPTAAAKPKPVAAAASPVIKAAAKPTPAPPANTDGDDVHIDEDEWSSLLSMVDESAAVANEELPAVEQKAVEQKMPPKPNKPISAPAAAAPAREPEPSSYEELYSADDAPADASSKAKDGGGGGASKQFTVVVCGAGRAGKSALVARVCNGVFSADYEPTLDKDVYKKRIELDTGPVELKIVDTAGVDENAEYRDQDYRSADGFVMTFSVIDGDSFKDMRNVVARQIAAAKGADLLRARKLPLVVVGTHADRNMGLRAVQRSDAAALARVLGAPYVEVSALDDAFCVEPFRLLARRLAFGDAYNEEQAEADAKQVAGMTRAQSTRDGRRGLHRPTFIAEQPGAPGRGGPDNIARSSDNVTRSQVLQTDDGGDGAPAAAPAAAAGAVRRPVGAVAMPGIGAGGGGGDALTAALARRAAGDPGRNPRAMSMRGPPSQLLRGPAATPAPAPARSAGGAPRGQSMMGMTSLLSQRSEPESVPPFGGVALQTRAPAAAPVAAALVEAGDTYGQLPLAPAAKQQVALAERAFWRACNRQEAEAYLSASPDGTFLLRPSTQPRAKCVLSSRSYAGEVGHALIQESERGFHLETVSGYFTSIDELLRSLPIDHDLID